MRVSLTVGKVDAGVAVLLTEDKRLIEFPSILLPPDIATGSVVDVNVSRNQKAEVQAAQAFDTLQAEILSTFGSEEPQTPALRCRNATQTSVVLEWDPISLATADLRSLALYRNGAKAGNIPRPLEMTSTKISGLAVDTEYTFSLVLRTSAGTFSSEKVQVKTHKMTDLHGITVTPGIMPAPLRESLEGTIEKVGAKMIEQIRIDTTHFVCTEGRGPAYEKAREMNIPVVLPDWVKGCEREGRLVGVRGYYLDANPKDRQIGQRPQSSQQQQRRARSNTPENRQVTSGEGRDTPTTNVIPPTPERRRAEPDAEEEGKAEDKEEEAASYAQISSEPEPASESQTEVQAEEVQKDSTDTADEDHEEEEMQAETDTPTVPKKRPSQETNGDISKTSEESVESIGSPPDSAVGEVGSKEGAGEEGKFDEVDL